MEHTKIFEKNGNKLDIGFATKLNTDRSDIQRAPSSERLSHQSRSVYDTNLHTYPIIQLSNKKKKRVYYYELDIKNTHKNKYIPKLVFKLNTVRIKTEFISVTVHLTLSYLNKTFSLII